MSRSNPLQMSLVRTLLLTWDLPALLCGTVSIARQGTAGWKEQSFSRWRIFEIYVYMGMEITDR
jgi:hypothetical protein